jgi:hypothetical protein
MYPAAPVTKTVLPERDMCECTAEFLRSMCIQREKAGKRLRVVKNFSILSKTVLFSPHNKLKRLRERKREREREKKKTKKKKRPRGGYIGGSSDGRPGRLGYRRKR